MLTEALTALAAAGGAAVVQAAGTDAWAGLRDRVARWFGRGVAEREHRELELLEASAADLAAADDSAVDRIRALQEVAWQTRFRTLLENLDEDERARAAADLRELLNRAAPQADGGGVAVSGNTFHGPTAIQTGNHSQQDNHFGPGA